MKRRLQEKKKLLCCPVALLLLVFIGYHLAYWDRVYPGVTIVNQKVGNKTVGEAISNLQFLISNFNKEKIILTHDEQEWEIDLAELDFSYDATSAAKKAYRVGRSGNLIADLTTKVRAWFSGIDLGLEYHLGQNLLETKIATIAAQVFVPAIDPQIKILDKNIEIEQGKEGQELDKRKLLSSLVSRLSSLDFSPIQLPIIHISPLLTKEQIENTRRRAEKFLDKKLTLVFNETRWELEEEELVDFLSFTGGFDLEKIASFSANLALVINRPPQNAIFQFQEGRVTQFRPAVEGLTLDRRKTLQAIKVALEEIEKEFSTGSGQEEKIIHLPVTETKPAITIDQINDLGIRELLGQGVSYFWGSIPSRIHNIALASSGLNGVLIPPGEIFSFNQTLGEVSPATGYQSAFVIKEGRTILGDGGGVCQVSTTLFRAALNAGLPIIERHQHSYRVSYYEQGGFGPGLDATVWRPGIDLKIKNDTPAYVLIQTKADLKTGSLTFALYGTSDGRKVTISKPKVWDRTPPPPDLYQDDPTLPAGTIKRIEQAVWGAKVSFDWKVTRGDEVLQERTFYSHYQPWRAVYLRGTLPQ